MTPPFHKIDHKTFKGIISRLHFSKFENILPQLIYFVDKIYIKIGLKIHQYSCFPLNRGGGSDLEKGGRGVWPLTNYDIAKVIPKYTWRQ